jgi:type III secretion protein V
VNISLSVIILLISLYIPQALEVSVFPDAAADHHAVPARADVSTTRLILSTGDAGEVVYAFGNFVVRGNFVVGASSSSSSRVVKFIVIAKGSERVAEVARASRSTRCPASRCRSTPSCARVDRQEEGKRKRRDLERESQLFGSMDGAMKFVKGDAIAGIIITVVNIVGGLAIGVGCRRA